MRVGGATLAAAAVRAGLVDEYTIVTHRSWWAPAHPSSPPWTAG